MIGLDDGGTIRKQKKRLKAVGDERLASWIRYAVGEDVDSFVDFVKSNYLSGQRMDVVTGETRDSVAGWLQNKLAGKRNAMVFLIRPGVGIHGMLNYLERFVGTSREFMRPAWRAFGQEGRIARDVDDNLERQLERFNKEEK